MRILTLAGWGQPHDALDVIAPGATHLAYAHHASLDEAVAAIAEEGKKHDMVIGWSLGGQLAARAIGKKLMQPKKLVLIGVPYQFVESDGAVHGMDAQTFETFRENFARSPERTLKKAWELVAKNDAAADQVRAYMALSDRESVLAADWLKWLFWLENLSAETLDHGAFPPTLLVHGKKDVVVAPRQAEAFAGALPLARLTLLDHAGHAPHWHDPVLLSKLIAEHAHV